MKKIIVTLGITVLLLASCAKATANVSNGSEYLFKGDVSLTKAQLFEYMKSSINTSSIVNKIVVKIGELEEIDQTKVDEYIESEKSFYESYIELYGEELVYDSLKYTPILEQLTDKYLDANLTKYVDSNNPYLATIGYVESKELADEIYKLASNGTDLYAAFEKVLTKNDIDEVDTYVQTKSYTDSDSLPYEVKEYVQTQEVSLSSIIPVSEEISVDGETSQSIKYYIVDLKSKEIDSFKDIYKEDLKESVTSTDVLDYFFDKYDVQIHDQSIYELLTSTYESLK